MALVVAMAKAAAPTHVAMMQPVQPRMPFRVLVVAVVVTRGATRGTGAVAVLVLVVVAAQTLKLALMPPAVGFRCLWLRLLVCRCCAWRLATATW